MSSIPTDCSRLPDNRKPLHPWTEEERTTLCLLKIASISSREVLLLFNHTHTIKSREAKPSTNLGESQLSSQFTEIKNGGKGCEIWFRIKHTPLNALYETFSNQIDQIHRAAQVHGIAVRFQPTKCSEPKASLKRKRLRSISLPITITSSAPDYDRSSSEDRETRGMKSVKIDCERLTGTGRPGLARTLVFRAFNPAHGFRARKFWDENDAIPAPPPIQSVSSRDDVRRHLFRDQTFQSPFMSFTSNPRNSLKVIELIKAAKSSHNTNDYHLAVFRFNDIQADATSRFGRGTGPFLVPTLLDKDDYIDIPDGYTGPNEWLVYGSINCEPLAVLDTKNAIDLAISIRKPKLFDTDAGKAIGQVLTKVPNRWKQFIAYQLMSAYPRRGRKMPKPNTVQYRDFMAGVSGSPVDRKDSVMAHTVDLEGLHDNDIDSEYEPNQPLQTARSMNLQEEVQTTAYQAVRTLNSLASRDCQSPRTSSTLEEWETEEEDEDEEMKDDTATSFEPNIPVLSSFRDSTPRLYSERVNNNTNIYVEAQDQEQRIFPDTITKDRPSSNRSSLPPYPQEVSSERPTPQFSQTSTIVAHNADMKRHDDVVVEIIDLTNDDSDDHEK